MARSTSLRAASSPCHPLFITACVSLCVLPPRPRFEVYPLRTAIDPGLSRARRLRPQTCEGQGEGGEKPVFRLAISPRGPQRNTFRVSQPSVTPACQASPSQSSEALTAMAAPPCLHVHRRNKEQGRLRADGRPPPGGTRSSEGRKYGSDAPERSRSNWW